jgi:hypothetical protein
MNFFSHRLGLAVLCLGLLVTLGGCETWGALDGAPLILTSPHAAQTAPTKVLVVLVDNVRMTRNDFSLARFIKPAADGLLMYGMRERMTGTFRFIGRAMNQATERRHLPITTILGSEMSQAQMVGITHLIAVSPRRSTTAQGAFTVNSSVGIFAVGNESPLWAGEVNFQDSIHVKQGEAFLQTLVPALKSSGVSWPDS